MKRRMRSITFSKARPHRGDAGGDDDSVSQNPAQGHASRRLSVRFEKSRRANIGAGYLLKGRNRAYTRLMSLNPGLLQRIAWPEPRRCFQSHLCATVPRDLQPRWPLSHSPSVAFHDPDTRRNLPDAYTLRAGKTQTRTISSRDKHVSDVKDREHRPSCLNAAKHPD